MYEPNSFRSSFAGYIDMMANSTISTRAENIIKSIGTNTLEAYDEMVDDYPIEADEMLNSIFNSVQGEIEKTLSLYNDKAHDHELCFWLDQIRNSVQGDIFSAEDNLPDIDTDFYGDLSDDLLSSSKSLDEYGGNDNVNRNFDYDFMDVDDDFDNPFENYTEDIPQNNEPAANFDIEDYADETSVVYERTQSGNEQKTISKRGGRVTVQKHGRIKASGKKGKGRH